MIDIITRLADQPRAVIQRALRLAGHRVSTGVIRRHVLAARQSTLSPAARQQGA